MEYCVCKGCGKTAPGRFRQSHTTSPSGWREPEGWASWNYCSPLCRVSDTESPMSEASIDRYLRKHGVV